MTLRKDLIIAAAFWGILAGLGEGICWFVHHSLIWPDLLRAATMWEPVLFIAVAILAQCSSRQLHPSTRAVALFVFVWLTLCDWSRTLWPSASQAAVVSAVFVASAIATLWLSRNMQAVVMFQRRALPVLLGLALGCIFVITWRARAQEQRQEAAVVSASKGAPNIVLIIEDTVRADHLSTYGYDRPTSPNLTQLAQQGVFFEDAVAPSAWTLPSHASILTGLYPHQHHAVTDFDQQPAANDSPVLGTGYLTLGEALMARGYRTAAFSGNTDVFTRERGFGRGFIRFEDDFRNWSGAFARTYYGQILSKVLVGLRLHPDKLGRTRANVVNRDALQWIDSGQGRHPFFVVLNYFDAHDPYLPPDPYLHSFSKAKNPGRFSSRLKLNPEQRRNTIDAYDGTLQYVDAQMGDFVRELKKRSLGDNSLVIVTADHGEALGEHGFFHHGNSLYRELIHVPLVFWEPGKIPAGQRIAVPVSLTALASTILRQVTNAEDNTFPEPSLAQLWQQPQAESNWPPPLSELSRLDWSNTFPNYYGAMESISTAQWHYIVGGKFGEQLFRCCSNLPETVDLSGSFDGRRVCHGFRNELEASHIPARLYMASAP